MPAKPSKPETKRLTHVASRAWCVATFTAGLISVALASPANAQTEGKGWSLGAYAGKYYDTEPPSFLAGRANFVEQYLLALTASKTVWQARSLPLALEIDAMVGVQGGVSNLQELAVAPTLRWSGMPWRDVLRADLRLAPLGLSYTTAVSSLERGPGGQGSKALNWLFVEAAFSSPRNTADEFFVRLHHRCTIYDWINAYGANGEDFVALGFRRRF